MIPIYAYVVQQQPAQPALKLRVIVAPVEVKVQGVAQTAPTPSGSVVTVTLDLQQPTEFGTGLTEMLTTALVQSERFQVFEEAGKDKSVFTVKAAITEFKLQRTLTGSQGQLAKAIDFSKGSATAVVAMDIRVVDNATGLVKYSVRAEGKATTKGQTLSLQAGDLKLGNSQFESSPLGKAVRDAVNSGAKLVGDKLAKLPWEARVADVAELDGKQQVYLNVGTGSGLKVGDTLELREAGEPITDPETGRVLGLRRGKALGECKVIEMTDDLTTCEATTPSTVKKGDIAIYVVNKRTS